LKSFEHSQSESFASLSSAKINKILWNYLEKQKHERWSKSNWLQQNI